MNEFGTKWQSMTPPCLEGVNLWQMLHIYAVVTLSLVTS